MGFPQRRPLPKPIAQRLAGDGEHPNGRYPQGMRHLRRLFALETQQKEHEDSAEK